MNFGLNVNCEGKRLCADNFGLCVRRVEIVIQVTKISQTNFHFKIKKKKFIFFAGNELDFVRGPLFPSHPLKFGLTLPPHQLIEDVNVLRVTSFRNYPE